VFSRALDAIAVGAASIVAVVALLVWGHPVGERLGAGATLALQSLINWPHFMAAYAVLYSSPESVRRYRAAALWVPAALAGYALFAVAVWTRQPIHATLIQWGAALYLGRHYTGQAWGMMASFAHVDGLRFSTGERRLIRGGLDLMMLWHMSWAAATISPLLSPAIAERCLWLYRHMMPVAVVSCALGAIGLAQMTRRIRRAPPARVLLPWLALYAWYLLLAIDPSAAIVVQLAHALQYLIFPLRIEVNRSPDEKQLIARRMLVWTVAGLALLAGGSGLFALFYRAAGGHSGVDGILTVVVSATVGVHHYFVDGTLYKLRNPDVRRDLFAHLGRAAEEARAA
jgi:hypothetical protein